MLSSILSSIPGLTFFLLHINDLPEEVNCNTAIYADDTNLYSKCDQAYDLWQQLEQASELESDNCGNVDWGREQFVDFNARKTTLVLFDHSNNTGTVDVKIDGHVLGQKSSFEILGLTFSSKLDWSSQMISVTTTAFKKIRPLIK